MPATDKLILKEEKPIVASRAGTRDTYAEHLNKLKRKANTWFKIMEATKKEVTTTAAYVRRHFSDEGFEFKVRQAGDNGMLYALYNPNYQDDDDVNNLSDDGDTNPEYNEDEEFINNLGLER